MKRFSDTSVSTFSQALGAWRPAGWTAFVLAGLALLALPLVSVATPESGSNAAPAAAASDTTHQDWHALSGGDSLAGAWRGFKSQDVPSGWSLEDSSVIAFAPPEEGEGGGDLVTKEQYESFELRFDWKISEGGNSGVIYRVGEGEERDATWQTGPEYQVLDNEGHADADNGRDRHAAANYALHAPSADVAKPAGEWNEARIVARGDSIEHWLNGEKVVAYELGSDDWKQRVADSKFSSMPGYGQKEAGHIALQDHGNKVWYRNVRVRRLSDSGGTDS